MWCLDVVPFPYHGDVTLQVTFQPGGEILGVRKDGPFVVELVLWKPGDKTVIYQNETEQLTVRTGNVLLLELGDLHICIRDIFMCDECRQKPLKNSLGRCVSC